MRVRLNPVSFFPTYLKHWWNMVPSNVVNGSEFIFKQKKILSLNILLKKKTQAFCIASKTLFARSSQYIFINLLGEFSLVNPIFVGILAKLKSFLHKPVLLKYCISLGTLLFSINICNILAIWCSAFPSWLNKLACHIANGLPLLQYFNAKNQLYWA